jgi:hypothetical protein
MKPTLIIAVMAFCRSGCAAAAPQSASEGDMTREGGIDCWYYCP